MQGHRDAYSLINAEREFTSILIWVREFNITYRLVAQVLDATVQVRGFAQQRRHVFGSDLIKERTRWRSSGGGCHSGRRRCLRTT